MHTTGYKRRDGGNDMSPSGDGGHNAAHAGNHYDEPYMDGQAPDGGTEMPRMTVPYRNLGSYPPGEVPK